MDGEQRFIDKSLERLGLPYPAQYERLTPDDGGWLAFINPAACVLRVIYKNCLPLFGEGVDRYDDILQPLGRMEEGNVIVALYPGLHTPALTTAVDFNDAAHSRGKAAAEAVKCGLRFSGYDFFDAHPFNIGYLPKTGSVDEPEGKPVILDFGGIKVDPAACRTFHRRVQEAGAGLTPVQDGLYADLRKAFDAAVQGRARDRERLWEACAAAKEQGRLRADWERVTYTGDYHLSRMPDNAAAYEKRLRQLPAFTYL